MTKFSKTNNWHDYEKSKYLGDIDDDVVVNVVRGKALKDLLVSVYQQANATGIEYNSDLIEEFEEGVLSVHFLLDGAELFQIFIGISGAPSTLIAGETRNIGTARLSPAATIRRLSFTQVTINKNQSIGTRLGIFQALGDTGTTFQILQDIDNAFELTENNILRNTRLIDEGTYQIAVRATADNSEIIEVFDIFVVGAGEITNINLSAFAVAVDAVVDTIVGIFSISGGAPPSTFELVNDAGGILKIENDDELRVASVPVGIVGDLLEIAVTATDVNGTTRTESFTIEVVTSTFVNSFSYTFDGVSEFLRIENDASLYGGQHFSCVAWVKQTVFGGSNVMASHFGAGGTRSWRFYLNGTGNVVANISQNGTASESVTSTIPITINEWNMVCFSFDGENLELKIWINDVLNITGAITIDTLKNTSVPMRIGARGDTAVDEIDFFDGNIDETSVYNKSIDQTDIDSLYNSGDPINPNASTAAANLISHWRCGDNLTGSIDPDEILSNDATLSGGMNNSNRDADVPTSA